MALKKLPIGLDGFEKIRENDFYYVDKTMFIAELLENWGEVNLFTRPRRFGKSLNMSMLKSFFEIGTEKNIFEGLRISEEKGLCERYMGKFPVISISLKSVDGQNFGMAVSAMRNLIGREALRFTFLLDSVQLTPYEKEMYKQLIQVGEENQAIFSMSDTVLQDSLRTLSQLLTKHYGKKTIILIDEYDVPLDKAFQNGYYPEMISLIRQLFGAALKTNEDLQFAVLTGCLRISKESIFTGLNNLKVHGITDIRYDEFFGFTGQDVRELLDYYGLSAYAGRMKQWYNGYRFGDVSVYCPWDVINDCDVLRVAPEREPEDYWANSSGNDMVKRFIHSADQQTRYEIEQLIEGNAIVKEISQTLTYSDLDNSIDNLWSVLFTTGYLTVKEQLSQRKFRLVIPNMEIRDLFVSQVREWFKEKVTAEPEKLNELSDAFLEGDAALVQNCLTDYLKQTISIRDSSTQKTRKESFYHGILLGLLSYPKRWSIHSNEEAGDGYSDIVIRDVETDTGIIIEIKYAEHGAFDAACSKALAQIRTRSYAEVLEEMEHIRKYGIAFYKKQCRVVLDEETAQ